MARLRCYTNPSKSQYKCPLCEKPLVVRRCMNAKYAMYGCMYVQCKKHIAPYEGWPARFEWITNWYYAGDKAQPPPLWPSALPLSMNAPTKNEGRDKKGALPAGAQLVINLTGPEGGTVDNPIILL